MASLGIMGAKLRAPLKPFNTIDFCDSPSGFKGALNWVLMMPIDASLSDRYTSDHGFFSACNALYKYDLFICIYVLRKKPKTKLVHVSHCSSNELTHFRSVF